jgi:mRNA-degrading endonuclease RelE of RelBE toxin-antitoxin system
MDKIEKALRILTMRERRWVKDVLVKLKSNDIHGIDVKKLKARADIYRVRRGSIRILYRLENGNIFLLKIDRRNDRTYNI